MLKFGRITEVNPSRGVARVHFEGDEIVSNWLPVTVMRAKTDQFSFSFVINEHVWCCMDERCEYGVIGGAIYDNKNPPGESSPGVLNLNMATNLHITIDGNNGTLNIECKGAVGLKALSVNVDSDVLITIKAPETKIDGKLIVTEEIQAQSIQANDDVKAGSISLKSHTHTSAPSGSPTSAPIL